jgi:WD40 repeat protein
MGDQTPSLDEIYFAALERDTSEARASYLDDVCGRDNDGQVRLWDVKARSLRKAVTGHSGPVWSVNFTPDGKTLASASSDRTFRLWPMKPSLGHVFAP